MRDACRESDGALRRLDENVSEWLEYRPVSRVIRRVCRKHDRRRRQTESQASIPNRPIGCRMAGPAFPMRMAIAKFIEHLPLSRQNVIYAREGVTLSRSTLADRFG